MVLSQAPASDFGKTLHAVTVGVDALPDDWLARLSVAERDAAALAHALTLASGIAAPPSHVQAITGPAATRTAVMDALRAAVGRTGPADSLIFYYAGHGLVTDGVFRLCAAGARPDALDETALSSTDLEEILADCPARGILIILDCCEGGAFAEAAPATFTRLRTGDYRLLVSASRANQRSWETADGAGTLFSQALIGVLLGEIQVGRVAGAIYFSDLVEAIEAHVAEGLEQRPGHPDQDMMFVGAYVRDPLVFVHRGLSLEQVRFATARYSPAHVRRLLLRSAAIVTGITVFCLAVAYGLQDQTQFARVDNGKLVILRGRPDYNLPGYPQLLWTLPFGPERLTGVASDGPFVLAAPLGRPVMPMIEARLRPDYRLINLYETGRSGEARALALANCNNAALPFEQRLNSGLMLAEVAIAADIPLLTNWLTGERRELRRSAFLALLRLQGTRNAAVSQTLAGEDVADHQDIVRAVDGPCTPVLTSYLERRFDSSGSHPTNEEILDAAVRTECSLSTASLVAATERPHLFGERDVAAYARLRGRERGLADALVLRLEAGDLDVWRAAGLVGTLVELQGAPCTPIYGPGLKSSILAARLMSMAAIARHCQAPRWRAGYDQALRSFLVSTETGGKAMTMSLDPHENDERVAIQYLIHLPELGLPVEGLADAARQLLPVVEDTQLKTELVATIIREGDRRPLPADLLDSNVLEVRNRVIEYRRAQGDGSLAGQLLDRLGGRDDFYVSLVGRMPLSSTDLARLQRRLNGSEDERRQVACVLAMQGDADLVVALLTDKDWTIRSEALACAPFNRAAEAILKATLRTFEGFPIEGYATLGQQVRRKRVLEQALQRLPADQRLWRLSILDKTPSGFGLWRRGMRDWIDEQIYQFELARRTTARRPG